MSTLFSLFVIYEFSFKVEAFLWRLSRNAIPVDERLLSIGFQLASQCSCCENPEEETINHLFLSGDTTSRTWRHFSDIFHLSSSASNIDQLTQVWLNKISLSSPSGICRNIIFGNVLWKIWKQRNDIILGNGKRNSNLIISRVSVTLLHHLGAHNLSSDEGVRIYRATISAGQQTGSAAAAGQNSVVATTGGQLRRRVDIDDSSREVSQRQGPPAADAQRSVGHPGAAGQNSAPQLRDGSGATGQNSVPQHRSGSGAAGQCYASQHRGISEGAAA